ncbi:hypothetical protein C7999DRAFT_14640 [Corynascus novoguineensis]|uniref:Fatty acid hydroxylase domain-containing protein n=1 Tax=Corynascus novoguineensis TaxID=1126955 RepID=A0AAN7CS38_9PEZI|nr:hypothetical protein C7999DRAFT_14640 [Corynascus novoguineensis]
MDLLLSLPVLSYFSGSLTSWSTSLNLLFFYMTWSTLVLSHSPLEVEIVGVAALRAALWLVPSLFFLAFDTLLPSLAENIKHNGASALPPRDVKALGKTAGLALFNFALELGVEAGMSLGLTTILNNSVFRTSTTLPLPWQIAKHLALLFTGREILTYYIHRYLLHGHPAPALHLFRYSGSSSSSSSKSKRTRSKPKYKRSLAALHSTYAHARPAPPYSLLLKADHPFPYLLHRLAPLYLPALALHPDGLHLLTYLLFVALVTLEETLALSGYAVLPGIVVGGMARRTAAHYATDKGNFGSWGVLDWAYGASVGGDVMGDLRDEAEKHRVRERGERKAGEVGGLVSDGIDGLRKGKRSGRTRKGKGGNGE